MSAFVGVVNMDGEPVDPVYLEDMARYLAKIGPDKQSIWAENGIGLVHALLKTTIAEVKSQQPCVHHRYVVVGDVRLDGKRSLLQSLRRSGFREPEAMQDVELVLHAWLTWGRAVTEHLIGDFTVVIWDRQERRLFCLRDQMGVKQLFYARRGKLLLFSNVLNCLRKHVLVSRKLNDQAVVDFLVLGFNSDPSTTVFNDISRLAPAHTLTVSRAATSVERYWSLPIEPTLAHANVFDYVEQFRALMVQAVDDKLSGEGAGILMSGGLDSTAVAAFSREVQPTASLALYTLDVASLWPEDNEQGYAALVAKKLKAPHSVHSATAKDLFACETCPDWELPEPSRDSFWPVYRSMLRQMAGRHRIGLTGHGADPLLMSSPNYFFSLLSAGRWGRFLSEAWQFHRVHGQRPPLGFRAHLKRKYERAPRKPVLPGWLQPSMAEGTGVMERFRQLSEPWSHGGPVLHPERNEAYQDLSSPIWPATLSRFDAQTTGLPIEFRHPYLDQRLLQFSLSMPASPWFNNKALLRFASRGILPDPVRLRKKSMPAVSPVYRGMLHRKTIDPGVDFFDHDEISKYLDVRQFRRLLQHPQRLTPNESDQAALPVAYANWVWLNSL